MSVGNYIVSQLINVVLVVVIGGIYTYVEILRAEDLVEYRNFESFVRGLSYVLVLVAVSGSCINGDTHQNVFCRIPVCFDATTQLAIPETKVKTNVTRNGLLPFKVIVSHEFCGFVNVGGNTVNSDDASGPHVITPE